MKPTSDKFIFVASGIQLDACRVQSKVLALCKDLRIPVKSFVEEKVNRTKEVKMWFSKKTHTVDNSYYHYVVELDNPTEIQWWTFHGACIGFGYGFFSAKGINSI